MDASIRQMVLADYDAVLTLWEATPGVDVAVGDERAQIAGFLDRNPGLSLVAESGGRIVGAVLCGHDGRRGYVHHLAVDVAARRSGLGLRLVEMCLDGLRAAGIGKCHLFIRRDNDIGRAFWVATGWIDRTTLSMMSRNL